MYLAKIRVLNYKPFDDSGEIEFKPGINLIVGQNSSGKTALLEALRLSFTPCKHNSVSGERNPAMAFQSRAEVFFTVDHEELVKWKDMRRSVVIPQPSGIPFDEAVNIFNEHYNNGLTIRFISTGSEIKPQNIFHDFYPEKQRGLRNSLVRLDFSEEANKFVAGEGEVDPEYSHTIGWSLLSPVLNGIYKFNAERPNVGKSSVGASRDLSPDGSNLAEVLVNTQTNNPDLFDEYNKYISQIFPFVKWVTSTRVEGGGTTGPNEVRVWAAEKGMRREDLAFPLSDCGTGIGQVLAILYVVVTSNTSRVIIIDEPNSFLHPGAAKKLIQILNRFPQHQYFISTHSPEILSAAKPATITELKYLDGHTISKAVNFEQTKDLRETLTEIGIDFSDVFFAENILWVEGPTEAAAFPLILETEQELFDVTFLPLVNTGDFREKKQARKNAKLAFEIYQRLSGAHALVPPFVGVIFDKEEENEREIEELERISAGKAKFIPRRMFENYLIDIEAIKEILNEELQDGRNVTAEEIEDWIQEKKLAKDHLPDQMKGKAINDEEWLENVDAAKFLDKLFSDLSEQTVDIEKLLIQ